MSYITSIGTANPTFCFTQETIGKFMVNAMQLEGNSARKLHALYRATGIETRYSVLSDYGKENELDFFSDKKKIEPFPGTKTRLNLFRKHALELSKASINNCFEKISFNDRLAITHLVVVSCTGMSAPGLDIDLVKALGLSPSLHRTCINFMGCYAAFNAIKLADTFCKADPASKVLIVCTELCSIHFQKENTEDNLLANALFADGSAALLMESSPQKGYSFKPLSFYCELIPEGEKDMGWAIGDFGFEMKLSTYVPQLIRKGIKKLTDSLLQKISIPFSSISFFVIHPGGKKILEAIEQELKINDNQNKFSREVLKKYGNMSSPTVLFVLSHLSRSLQPRDAGKNILSFAFGPGITLESMILQIEYR
ncbi:MAG: Naringenin-chalcone synthase [Cytophagales bacterium]|jgi:prepilin-type processing-associated H-X9-DG protein|nr:type III polyketide synthase [Bacteroidota bacterium]MBS1981875.1 type III polyketide synthase [Bacteroidota bacterium]WHZ07498.1 MAG: Naringenin-chalcone synthase [Cytophagales bacterium]